MHVMVDERTGRGSLLPLPQAEQDYSFGRLQDLHPFQVILSFILIDK